MEDSVDFLVNVRFSEVFIPDGCSSDSVFGIVRFQGSPGSIALIPDILLGKDLLLESGFLSGSSGQSFLYSTEVL